MRARATRDEQGVGLIIAVIFLVVMALFATSAMSRVSNHADHVKAFTRHQDAYLAMMTAYDQAVRDEIEADVAIPVGYDFTLGAGETMYGKMDAAMDQFFNANTPAQISENQNVEYSVFHQDLFTVGTDYSQAAKYAMGRYNYFGTVTNARLAMQIVRFEYDIDPDLGDSIWEVAVYGGTGQGGKLINGNVSIHGSVHALGQDILAGDIALDIGGTGGIYNNYDGMPKILEDGLYNDPLDLDMAANGLRLDDDGLETLDSTLRVKNGAVSISSGSVLIGENDGMVDPESRGQLAGVYVNNEWTGNSVDADGIPAKGIVNSVNGHGADYDDYGANQNVGFPMFDDIYDEATGQKYFNANPAVGEPTSYYLDGQTAYVGDVTIAPGSDTSNFYYNSTTGNGAGVVGVPVGTTVGTDTMPTRADVDVMIANGEFVIWFDGDTATLVVNGRTAIEGNITIENGQKGIDDTINYEGLGTMLAYDGGAGGGDVLIEVNMYTTEFPTINHIGIMAEDDFEIGSKSQLEIMGGFYAQDTISMNMQNEVAGTIVGNYFDLGGQVPSIYQVPAMEFSWTDDGRMIGKEGGNKGCGTCGDNTGLIWFEAGVLL